jgi:hypothetical protein
LKTPLNRTDSEDPTATEDDAVVREMDRRMKKAAASREWRLWCYVVGSLLGLTILFWLASLLGLGLLMAGF